MPYYKLQNICDVYKESGTAITNNQKYIDPYLNNTQKVKFYNENIFDKNSYTRVSEMADHIIFKKVLTQF